MKVEFPDEYLAGLWENMDWTAAEQKLAALQARLSLAAYRNDTAEIQRLQKQIVRDTDIKCLAVRHVVRSTSGPGVDGVRWTKPEEMMRAALALTSKDYHAQPLRQIHLIAKNSGKERYPQLPTYFDRAMNVLYGYSLLPVTEAHADKKSFGFRPGRSAQDAHAFVLDALKGKEAPELVVCGDVKGCYSHIQHSWILSHVPMDRKVLSEFLNAGYVFAGELFPSRDAGISEGSNLSPYIANYVLDGLQRHIYTALHGTEYPEDFADGDLIRFADDVVITVRSREAGERCVDALSSFLRERGLTLSQEKTRIRDVKEGFTFLARTYIKKEGVIYSYPSEKAVDRFIQELRATISQSRRSQRELILTLNRKLKGWAAYHKYSDAGDAFRKVDAAVQTALLEAAVARHPRMPVAKVKARYWYKESDGRHCYALPDDKSVRVVRLADTLLINHRKVKLSFDPFLDRDYAERITHAREVENVTGPYKAVWERQRGYCFYCGRPILADQPRTVIQLDPSRPPSARNSAYIHRMCEANEYEVIRTMEDIDILRPYDVRTILEGLTHPKQYSRTTSPITPRWKYYKLKEHFASCGSASVTLTFRQIEGIIQTKLPQTARKLADWWYPRSNRNRIAEAWETEGYTVARIDIDHEKITCRRQEEGLERLQIPKVLLSNKIPANAVFELETHMEYIIEKYGLNKRER